MRDFSLFPTQNYTMSFFTTSWYQYYFRYFSTFLVTYLCLNQLTCPFTCPNHFNQYSLLFSTISLLLKTNLFILSNHTYATKHNLNS